MGAEGLAGAAPGVGGFVAQVLRWPTLLGLACYGSSAFLYILALRRIPMSVALPCTAASYVAIALIGWWFFREPLGAQKVAAILFIATGVVLLATS
ncbi:MAG: EamA family transporter [Acetobacteraceae bacterium]|nr:EamA family transporter [Acetobacteraceae bacterium]